MSLRSPHSRQTAIAVPESPRRAEPRDLTLLTDADLHDLTAGTATQLYRSLGAHPLTTDGVDGTCFAVWASNAERVSVIGDFNRWEAERHLLCQRSHSGV
jgi:1,4-alpha-glucan branching enzyme